MFHKTLLICNILVFIRSETTLSSETCIGGICEESVAMPLLDKMDAALKAEVDVSKLNKHLQAYIKQEIQKGLKNGITQMLNSKTTETKVWMRTLLDQKFKEYSERPQVTTPAFHASLLRHHQFSKHGLILKFEHIWTNIENGYNNSTGIFTAPRSGLYQILATIYSMRKGHCHTYLYKNNVLLNYGYAGSHNADSGTLHAVLTLQKGDKIYVKNRGGGSRNDIAHGYYHSEFSGFLIH